MARKPHMVPVGGSPGKAKVAPAPTLPASTITITKLNPNTSVHNQMAHVLIDGTGFVNGAQIEVVGVGTGPNATSYISANQVESNYLFPANVGTYQVGVRNPGEALSNTLPYTLT